MDAIQAKQVVKYAVMPEIIPRARRLFASGFGYFAFLMAQIYGMVRLLPANHPYLNPQHIGRFGIRHVIAEAANHLELKKENIDQIIIFGALLLGVLLLILQLLFLAYGLIIQPAMATSVFVTPVANRDTDIAFMLLDQVFGVPNFFESCVSTGVLCPGQTGPVPAFPWPFHLALQEMFRFYSTGLLLVGFLIFLYFIVVVVAETATTGTPFGQRFQNVWVPIRLVVAIGLLVPLNNGLNSAQYITLAAAKYGSGFATNSWLRFNAALAADPLFAAGGQNPTGERNSLIALPKPSNASLLVQSMSIIHACAVAHWIQDDEIKTSDPMAPNLGFKIRPYFVKTGATWMANINDRLAVTPATSYADALKFFNNSDIIFRFGIYDNTLYSKEKGHVEPTCGEIRVPITDLGNIGNGPAIGGSDAMQQFYYDSVIKMWFNDTQFTDFARRYVVKAMTLKKSEVDQCNYGCGNPTLPSCTVGAGGGEAPCATDDVTAEWRQKVIDDYQVAINAALQNAWDTYNNNGTDIEMTNDILERGWGGAGIWFNKLAQVNGSFMNAVLAIPVINRYPQVMEDVREERQIHDPDITGINQFLPFLSDGQTVEIPSGSKGGAIAIVLNSVVQYWNKDVANQDGDDPYFTGGMLEAAMNMIFGLDGLFDMTKENAHIHPLAQLTALGKGMVESSIRNIALSSLAAALSGPTKAIDNTPGQLADAASDFLVGTAFIGLTAGLVLYYVVPFLPFVYFYFAVASWLKTIFEAMVGAPLWALAHLRLDGDGLPGDSASNGYFLIFEIFVRPILTVFGLIAALVIFTAQVRVLHFIWELVTKNLAGFSTDPTIGTMGGQDDFMFNRGIIDQFFFTILYAIIVYLMATASFKLIDKIPDNILRWMGGSVSSFGDINPDASDKLTSYASLGGMTIGPQVARGVQGFSKEAGNAAGGEIQKLAQTMKK